MKRNMGICSLFLVLCLRLQATQTLYPICDTGHIYHESYRYSLPRSILESYLSGKAFDNLTCYTEEEAQNVQEDINDIYQNILAKNPLKQKLAVMTAGGPGAGKTILMKQDLRGKNIAYIDPDDVCLKSQTRTYLADIEKSDKSKEQRQAAYNKWRPASNAATHLILGQLIQDGCAFYFGTTSTGPVTNKFLDFLKKQGYHIRLIHVSAPDDVRWGSIQERDKTFVQTTEQDVEEKGLLLPQRIMDTYLAFADEIEFYYREGVHENAKLAATWTRNEAGASKLGALEIKSRDQYEKIKTIHNEALKQLNRLELSWESTVEKNSRITH